MDKRQQNLLNYIIREYIKTAQPVSSGSLVKKYKLGLSSATLRGEMAELEKQNYIYKPHTSAGRMPTEKGYEFYIKNFVISEEPQRQVNKILNFTNQKIKENRAALIKKIAKRAADYSKETIIVAFSPDNVYCTGIANLFIKPEFRTLTIVYKISSVIDHLDDGLEDLFEKAENDVKILIGKENPFSKECSVIFTTCKILPQQKSIFCLLGPMRMDYEKNLTLVKYVNQLI